MRAQTYFRLCLFVPLIVPLPFLVFKGDEGLSILFIGSLVFGMPPYVLVFVFPLLFLIGKMSERQIVMGAIFFPLVYPLVFGLFWSIVPNFINTMTITLSNPSQWVFTSVLIPAAYSMVFLSGNIIRKLLSGEMGLLEQRVVAVLCADSKTGGQSPDKAETAKLLSDYQQVCVPIINEHHGQQTNRAGDTLVVEFASVMNAVKCGMSLQQKFKTLKTEQPSLTAINLGFGIHLGEVKNKGKDIHGHGVTVATHLEELAEAGDMCISGTVYDRIRKKLIFSYDYLGEHSFQAIDSPVRVYRLKLDSGIPAIASETKPEVKLTIPDKPSIAVLPFDNMSADPEQEYFSDGITEDIITDLSKISGLLVISRHSTFAYKGKSIHVSQVSKDLGVRYVLEGSVRKAGERIRINAQLIDAMTDQHLWADRFDRKLDDIFEVQDEVTRKIVSALEIKLNNLEEKRLGYQGTENIKAHDFLLRAIEQFQLFTQKGLANALELYSLAIEIDPNYARAYSGKSRCLIYPFAVNFNRSSEETVIPALVSAKKSVELDELLPHAHASLGWALLWNREIDRAISEGKRAVILDPNFADGHMWLSIIYSSAGKGDEALESIEKATRLNPYFGITYFMAHGLAYFVLGQYEKALSYFMGGIENNPNFIPNHIFTTGLLGLLDRKEEAHSSADKLVKLNPNYVATIDGLVATIFNDKKMAEILNKGMNKAGLKTNFR